MEEKCIEKLLDPNFPSNEKLKLKQLLCNFSSLIVNESSFVEEIYKIESHKATTSNVYCNSILTLNEFNNFLFDLMSNTENENSYRSKNPEKLVPSAIKYLLQNKLKSFLGKAPDFFALLQLSLKKYLMASENITIPEWKLQFVFQLEQQILLYVHGSYVLHSDVSEVNNFYPQLSCVASIFSVLT